MTKHLTTPKIEEAAHRLGIKRDTVYQWRKRGVSMRMRIKLVQLTNGQISLSDFPDPIKAESSDGRA